MTFLFPSLTIAFALLAVPLLVHLINVLRQRKRDWAAMEFLLSSYRKQRKWIWLRQLLLLLLRTAAVALLVAMLAGWSGQGRWLDPLGGMTNHHLIVLDDSLSMADGSGGSVAYRRALNAIEALHKRLLQADGSHQLTVLRTSRARLVVEGGSQAGDAAADLSAQTVGPENRSINRLMSTTASSLSGGMEAALELAAALDEATAADRQIVYVMTDLRKADWENPERVSAILDEISQSGTEIRFVDCSSSPGSNLGITSLAPLEDVWVAGVPVVLEAEFRNYGSSPIRNVTVDVELIQYPKDLATVATDQPYSGTRSPLPSLVLESIEPGQSITQRFQVYVAEPGVHAVNLSLPEDVLAGDNQRCCTLPLIEQQKVLIVDSDAEGTAAYFVSSVLNPGGQVQTGAIPDVRPPSYLSGVSTEELGQYRVIYLLDLPRVNDAVGRKLKSYVEAGGGLAWFLGEACDVDQYNQILDGSSGLLPGTLNSPLDLPLVPGSTSPDLIADRVHPVAEPFVSADDILGLVRVVRSRGLEIDPVLGVRTILKRRDDQPYALQHRLGKGRIVTTLSSLGDRWTNWPGDPTFVIYLLRCNAFLWSGANPATSRSIDEPLAITLPADRYGRNLELIGSSLSVPRVSVQIQADPDEENGSILSASLSPTTAAIEGTLELQTLIEAGVYEWVTTRTDGSQSVQPVASVIEGNEGELRRTSQTELMQALLPAKIRFYDVGQMSAESQTSSGGRYTSMLLALLAICLILEQIAAYLGSYHPPLGAAT